MAQVELAGKWKTISRSRFSQVHTSTKFRGFGIELIMKLLEDKKMFEQTQQQEVKHKTVLYINLQPSYYTK